MQLFASPSFRVGLVLAIAVAATACGKGKDGDKGGAAAGLASCSTPALKECTEYNQGNRALGDDYLKKLCDGFEGTFATTGCPTAARAGSCAKNEGTKVFYDGYLVPVADLEKMCTDGGGKWRKP